MNAETQDVISVGRVEVLLVRRSVVDHTQCRYVVNYLPVLGVVQVATTVITTITACVCVCVRVRACCV